MSKHPAGRRPRRSPPNRLLGADPSPRRLDPSFGSDGRLGSPCGELSGCDPPRVVAPRRGLRHRPPHRCLFCRGGAQGGDRLAPSASGINPSLRSRPQYAIEDYGGELARARNDTAIVEAMAISDEFEHYRWRRVQAALRQQGLLVNRKKIRRLMREHDLQPRTRRRFVATTDSDHDEPIFPNRVLGMIVDGPNQLWVADIT